MIIVVMLLIACDFSISIFLQINKVVFIITRK